MVQTVHTRFPPEPNGYLHIGSAKAIYINYMAAKTYGGKFNLRFDDTNPAREGDEYVQSILKDLEWLGATPNGGIYYGSDYFEQCYAYAEKLIQEGKAYVDDLTRDEMLEYRGAAAGRRRRRALGRSRGGAAQDRPSQPQHESAGPGNLPHQALPPSPAGGQVVHLSAVRLCPSHSGRH